MIDGGLLALAMGAGMLAAVNPCGFALLPAYLGLLIGADTSTTRASAVRRALGLTAAMTAGFIAVFAVFGLVIAPLASGVQQYLPWVTLVVGIALVLAGLWLVAGRSLPTLTLPTIPTRRTGSRSKGLQRGVGSMFRFGVSYALASLTCTIGPFLAIVVSTLRTGSAVTGVTAFVAYGLGMGVVVGVAAVAVALVRTTLVDRMRGASRGVSRVAGGLMVIVGAYVAYYGFWEIGVLAGGPTDNPVIQTAARIQQTLATFLLGVGPLRLAVILVVLVAAVVIGSRLPALRSRTASHNR